MTPGGWMMNKVADFIGWWFTGPAPHPCSCVKKTHLNWTEILVRDPHCLAHGGAEVNR